MAKKEKIIIAGGGYAGLSFAALMASYGHDVTVYEAHTYLGGCASFFKRGPFKFDCGATTLSGLAPERPLHRLIEILNLKLDTVYLECPMQIHLSSGEKINRYSDFDLFMKELKKVFPHLSHSSYWKGLKDKEERLWKILSASQYFPPKGVNDLFKLLTLDTIKNADLGYHAFKTLASNTPSPLLADRKYQDFLNEQLIISTQSKIKEVPGLIGAMGLIYPDDMHYCFGGISTLAYKLKDSIIQNGGQVYERHIVDKVTNFGDEIKVFGRRPAGKTFENQSDIFVSALTIWDTLKILEKDLVPDFSKKFGITDRNSTRGSWGAMTATFAVKSKTSITPLYHQVHYKNDSNNKGSYFFSFSHPEDKERAPQGYQTVTVSTHSRPEEWNESLDKSVYLEIKKQFEDKVLTTFNEVFSKYEIESIEKIAVGTPRTFERFTRRHRGLVGGLPHNKNNTILSFPSQETPIRNFYQIGDTTFPGQGIVGVTTGALILASKILGKSLLKSGQFY